MTGDAAGLAALVVLMLMAVCVAAASWRLQRRVVDEWTNHLGKPGSCPVCCEGCAVRNEACNRCWFKRKNDEAIAAERDRVEGCAEMTPEHRALYLEHFERGMRSRER